VTGGPGPQEEPEQGDERTSHHADGATLCPLRALIADLLQRRRGDSVLAGLFLQSGEPPADPLRTGRVDGISTCGD